MDLDKKHFLVTGASSGIGRALALALSSEDSVIHAVGRNEHSLQELSNEIGPGGTCIMYHTNIRNHDERRALFESVSKETDHLDWIIHSAGYIDPHESEKMEESSIAATFETNVYAPMMITALFEKKLADEGGILFVSSTAGLWSSPRFPSKAALNAYARALARQWSSSHRSSISLCPGATNTPMREVAAHDAHQHQSPTVVAEVISRIIKGDSSYKNGDIIVVRDGVDTLNSSMDER